MDGEVADAVLLANQPGQLWREGVSEARPCGDTIMLAVRHHLLDRRDQDQIALGQMHESGERYKYPRPAELAKLMELPIPIACERRADGWRSCITRAFSDEAASRFVEENATKQISRAVFRFRKDGNLSRQPEQFSEAGQ
jgi:hypothetical protein